MSTTLFLRHQTQPGRRDEFREVWARHLAPLVAANPGHLAYSWNFVEDDPDAVIVFQQYADAEAAAAFLQKPEYLAYLKESEPLLSGPPELTRGTPIWQKG